ncbi:MAG: fumarylacetoacetate hydrolase family protein [Actinomycetota bacterium]|nr:fumarylacetoacetate hydrolase family protein [Actinomycetota bacterium]
MALNIPEIEAEVGGQPAVGYLASDTWLAGTTFDSRGVVRLRAECEVVVELSDDIGPQVGLNRLRNAVGRMAVGLELVEVGRYRGDVKSIIAHNVFHRAFSVGEFSSPRSEPLTAVCRVNGEVRQVRRVECGWVEPLVHIAHQLSLVNLELRANDWIFTGAQTHVAVSAGDQLEVGIDHLGYLEMKIV